MRSIEDHHKTRESGSGCPDADGGPHYFAYLDDSVDYRICIDCGEPEGEPESGAIGGKCRTCGNDLVRELDGEKRIYHPATLGDLDCSALIVRETSGGSSYKTGLVPFSEFIEEKK